MLTQDTRERILETAQRLAQQRGFNAFSYADISEAVGIRKASIHYHFPSKDDLELALLHRYNQGFADALAGIEQSHASSAARLTAYAQLYRGTLESGGICLCGMMASDIAALPELLRAPLGEFFTQQSDWLAVQLESGRRAGELVFAGPAILQARSVLATLQGALMIAHALRDVALFDSLVNNLLAGVGCR